ncbi:hypothetical protein BCR44DRAFT_1463995 [Catenaria anguillulae PL171]|uniref:Uncharacterized protein n=1 Tax=Catenaria anguillulae PL171 TaxID=765915 RepID=A0A1Y2H9N7_9FUNG|nr:hypothetical protein BCR44DRAFT_1463995 [Catenaria anguillulae PL171]
MDVNSLYTDMQIVVVKRAVARMVSHNAFDEVIDFICGNNLFTYVGNIYHQLDGIAMGTDASSTSTGNEKDAGITAAAGVAAGSSNRGGGYANKYTTANGQVAQEGKVGFPRSWSPWTLDW